jgi:large subunit ribosomal protein L31
MKEGIHPNYPAARVSCACGSSFVTRSTRGDFQVDVCSKCHPFYTGTVKLLDTAGRVDRFNKRYAASKKGKAEAAAKAAEAPKAEEPKAD